ncbi:MAG: DNA repair protein MmcB-related protein [Alphaproteobacteria bacterium]|nr:MAG: DNA repair protein MmcB-related protein [Alphaproteobacteria bacterium]
MPLSKPFLASDGAPAAEADVARGVSRLLKAMGFAPMTEVKLGNSRRADVAGINRRGMMAIVEIKTSVADLRHDTKWPDYLSFCDCFYFAVPPTFPAALFDESAYLPERTGLIIADRFGGQVMREAPEVRMNAGRRRTETLRFARRAAARLHRLEDPGI